MLRIVSERLIVGCVAALALLAGCARGGRDSDRIAEELPPMKEVCSMFRASKPADRSAWTFAKNTFPLDAIPLGARASALQQIARLRAVARLDGGPRWTSIGPAPIMVTEGGIARPTAGRVASIAIDPRDPKHWLIGAAHGGVWETRDAGASWEPRTDDQLSLAMGAIAFAPSNPLIVYAGTGEAVFSRSTYGGEGLLKSQNGGKDWQPIATTEFSGAAFSNVSVDPENADVVIAATTHAGVASIPGTLPVRGVFKSKRGGQTGTWARTLDGEATDLKVKPGDFPKQYAGIGDICGSKDNGVFRSLDGGEQWEIIAGPWKATGAVGRVELAIAPSRPDVLYVSIQRSPDASFDGGDLLGLWRTDNAWDATPTWREIASAKDLDLGNGIRGSYCSYVSAQRTVAQCWYDHVLSVDPDDANVLYAGGIALWRYDSTDWRMIGNRPELHVDQHAMAWVGRQLVVGNDGGVWSTTDPATGWTPHNETLATNQIWRGSIDPTNDRVALAGNQDDGTTRWTGTLQWQSVLGGDGAASAIAKDNSSTHWAVSYQRAAFYRTTNGGASFVSAAGSISQEPEEKRPFITPFEKCPRNDDVFVAGTVKPWRIENYFSASMPTWAVNGPDLGALIRAITFAQSDKTCRTYAVGTADGKLHRTTTGGGSKAAWSPLDPNGHVAPRMITSLAFHPDNANTLYVTVGGFDQGTPDRPGHLFRTTNALSASPQWTRITGTSNLPHNAVAIDPTKPQVMYVGTDVGLWYTTDGGAHWDHMGPERGLPNVAVSDVRVHPQTRRVFAFTFGRGVFVLDPGA